MEWLEVLWEIILEYRYLWENLAELLAWFAIVFVFCFVKFYDEECI